jgi:hypothetical protein
VFAGNTLFFEGMRQRRRVKGDLWPIEKRADAEAELVLDFRSLKASLSRFSGEDLLWIGELFRVENLPEDVTVAVDTFARQINLCPEC